MIRFKNHHSAGGYGGLLQALEQKIHGTTPIDQNPQLPLEGHYIRYFSTWFPHVHN